MRKAINRKVASLRKAYAEKHRDEAQQILARNKVSNLRRHPACNLPGVCASNRRLFRRKNQLCGFEVLSPEPKSAPASSWARKARWGRVLLAAQAVRQQHQLLLSQHQPVSIKMSRGNPDLSPCLSSVSGARLSCPARLMWKPMCSRRPILFLHTRPGSISCEMSWQLRLAGACSTQTRQVWPPRRASTEHFVH